MKQLLIVILFIIPLVVQAQQPADKNAIRIVDTLSSQERTSRNPVLLRAEVDSMIAAYNASLPKTIPQETVKDEAGDIPLYLIIISSAAFILVAVLLFLLFRNQKKFSRVVYMLNKQIQHLEWTINSNIEKPVSTSVTGSVKGKSSVATMEKKIHALTAELDKKTKEVEGLEMVMNEYRHIKQEYESVKQQMMDVYKIRNYPGYTKEKSETEIIRNLLSTERSVAVYAYDHFLKPIIAIADANKNNPAKIDAAEKDRIVDLLLSLALLYSEYLYLRVNELAIGGKMVERIASFQKGNGIDKGLLKELNTEHGSRALALRVALDKMGIKQLSYPVFDETNLNLS